MERFDAIVLGVNLGTADGWNKIDTFCIVFYDFQPNSKTTLHTGDLTVDYGNGKFEYYDDEGKKTAELDILSVLNNGAHD